MNPSQIWRALDVLAARRRLTASGLARAAGLDPTTFNKSKRQSPAGKPRWPSTESIARALDAAETNWDAFAALLDGRDGGAGVAIPIVAMADADGGFDDSGFPIAADQTVRFPDLGEDRIYALEISGDLLGPVYRAGDIVIVQPGAGVRRGDRVVVRTRSGELMAKVLGRTNDQTIELVSLNPAHRPRELATVDVDWIARILWASQ